MYKYVYKVSQMDIFPYVSSYILLYAVVAFLVFLVVPAPYGKFSKDYMPLQVNPRIAWFLKDFGALFFLLIGWFEDGKWQHQLPTTGKGWSCFIFLIIHFLWRSSLSQLAIEFVIKPPNGKKKTSILLSLLGLVYTSFVGMNLRRMCAQITEEFEDKDTIFIVGASVCLLANAFVDMQFNLWRREEGSDVSDYFGRYLTKSEIGERFGLLNKLGFECPNYLFEMLEWGLFTLLAFKWEAFWWFVSTVLFLLPRSIWTSHWYTLDREKEQAYEKIVPKVFKNKPKINSFSF